MTLQELENTLPNGLHDAEVRRIVVDYTQHKLTFDLAIWIGDVNHPPEKREAYKNGWLEISGLFYFAIDPPDPNYVSKNLLTPTIDSIDDKDNIGTDHLKTFPPNVFFRRFFCVSMERMHALCRDQCRDRLDGRRRHYL